MRSSIETSQNVAEALPATLTDSAGKVLQTQQSMQWAELKLLANEVATGSPGWGCFR